MYRNIIIFLFAFACCNGNSQQLETPKQFLNHVTAAAGLYSKDSTALVAALYTKMKNHEASFANPEYFDSTVLMIDTIMYDSILNKIAVFVVTKNPTHRNPHSDSELLYY